MTGKTPCSGSRRTSTYKQFCYFIFFFNACGWNLEATRKVYTISESRGRNDKVCGHLANYNLHVQNVFNTIVTDHALYGQP